jgi:hypothetical protein
MKDTISYLNLLGSQVKDRWEEVPGTDGKCWMFTITQDPETGHYTRLTRFDPGADTGDLGAMVHDYQEEVLILQGDLHDSAFDLTLVAGDYCCRPLHEKHGPFTTRTGCLAFEVAYPVKG